MKDSTEATPSYTRVILERPTHYGTRTEKMMINHYVLPNAVRSYGLIAIHTDGFGLQSTQVDQQYVLETRAIQFYDQLVNKYLRLGWKFSEHTLNIML